MTEPNKLSQYVKTMRKQYGLTQEDLSAKSGVGIRFVRDLEQGKKTLRMDKVNCVLALFGSELGVIRQEKGGVEL
ncbi:MAG: helix-turn-helix transcriptional regulator [Prevotella sp.]|nr:helix-turn-helix transcriptional regulator [Prevotella sp.]